MREAMQIFGGAAYTRSGVGEKIERLYRDAKAYTCAPSRFLSPLRLVAQPDTLYSAQDSRRLVRDHGASLPVPYERARSLGD